MNTLSRFLKKIFRYCFAGSTVLRVLLLVAIGGAVQAAAQIVSEPFWTQLSPATPPSARYSAGMVYDPIRGNVVLFGGLVSSSSYLSDTWTLASNGAWVSSPATGPSARSQVSMTFDPAAGTILLFGGRTSSTAASSETWTWNGGSWTRLSPATSPSARYAAGMAYDPATGTTVLYGGVGPTGTALTDTWTWNGTTWTQKSPSTVPPGSGYVASMAYDQTHGYMLMGNFLGTYKWDGTNWTSLAGSSPNTSGIVYDDRFGLVLAYNGSKTYGWNGTVWAGVEDKSFLPSRTSSSVAYNSSTQELVVFGGTSSGAVQDTWVLDYGQVVVPWMPVGSTLEFAIPFYNNSPSDTPTGTPTVVTQGSSGGDFSYVYQGTCLTGGLDPNVDCSMYANFAPLAPGASSGAVTVRAYNNTSALATTMAYGIGTAPLALTATPTQATTYTTGLSGPHSLKADRLGNLYFSDHGSQTVYRIAAGGTTLTPLTTANNPTGVAVDGFGSVFYGASGDNKIYKLAGGSGSPVAVASITGPDHGMVADALGNIYVSSFDASHPGSIYKIGYETQAATMIYAGATGQRFIGMAIDSYGTLYVADSANNILYKLPAGDTQLIPLVTGGALSTPVSVAVDAAGNVYVTNSADTSNVLRYSAGTYALTTLPAVGSDCVAVDSRGTIYTMTSTTLTSYTRSGLAYSFPSTQVNSTASQSLWLENDGNLPLTFSVPASGTNPALSGLGYAFGAGGTCPVVSSSGTAQSLAAGSSCSVPVVFKPTTVSATNSGSLVFTDNSLNATGATQTFTLSGASTGTSTTTVLTTNPTTRANIGSTVTLTATVTPAAATGFVQFYDNGTALGSTQAVNGGVATYAYANFPVGSHTLTSKFTGTGTYATSTSNSVSLVGQSSVTLTLAILQNQQPVSTISQRSPITLKATVTTAGSLPAHGVVLFCDGSSTHCTDVHLLGTTALQSDGTAALNLRPGATGTYSYYAMLQVESTALAATSATQSLTVLLYRTNTTTVLSQSGSVGNYALTGTVAGYNPAYPTGTLSFVDTSNGNAVLGTGTLALSTLNANFYNASTPTVSNNPAALVQADFNGDGYLDLAVLDTADSTITVLLGDGSGRFTPPSQFTVSGNPYSMSAADLNGDGIMDLVVSLNGGSNFALLLGKGDGTFTNSGTVNFDSRYNYASEGIVAADFNNDGYPDLAVATAGNTVFPLLNNGLGTFSVKPYVGAGAGPIALVAADFNRDGNMDIATLNSSGSVTVLLGHGDGTFTGNPSSAATGSNPSTIVVGDFNHDGIPDLAVANAGSNTVTILLGQGNGSFGSITFSTITSPQAIAAGDFDGDGIPDLAVVSTSSGSIGLYHGLGDGNFAAMTGTYGSSPAAPVLLADINNDGELDMIYGHQSGALNIELNEFDTSYTSTATISGINLQTAGSHAVTANYPGDTYNYSSTSAPLSLSGDTATTTALAANPSNALSPGQTTKLTATVTPSTATGSVSFYQNGNLLGAVALNNGTATYTTGGLASGTYSMQAVFTGASGYANSSSSTVAVRVFSAPTLSLGSVIVVVGSATAVTVTATETGSNGTASGNTVTFGASASVGGTFNPSSCVLSAGSCSVSYTPAGTTPVGWYSNVITASFDAASTPGYLAGSTVTGLNVNTPVDTLIAFTGAGGANPGQLPYVVTLAQRSDGNFYGLTSGGSGRSASAGTFFRLTPAGVMTVLHSFNINAGIIGGVIQGSDGNFYGATSGDGAYYYGTVFKLSPSGDFTVLHAFTGGDDQGYAQGPLIEATDGNLYGMTEGTNTAGTVFRIARDGSGFATIHTFDYATEGYAAANPIQASDGKLYGTLVAGPSPCGNVFSMTLDGTTSVLHAFSSSEGCTPIASVVEGSDGALYGVARLGGSANFGTVYRISLTGQETTLYSFQGSEGAYPEIALTQGTDGNLYGTTSYTKSANGVAGAGTVFTITPAGSLTKLAQLPTNWDPDNPLQQATDGSLYGMDGGTASTNYGHIFRVHPLQSLSAPVSLSAPSTVTAGSTFSLTYAALNAYSQTTQRCFATNSTPDRADWTGVWTATPTAATTPLQASSVPGMYTYSLTCGGVETNRVNITVQSGPQNTQTILFTQPATPTFVNATATLMATGGGSANPVTFSIVSGPATLSGTNNSIITYTGAGTVVIAANQAGDATYLAATQVVRTVTVIMQSVLIVNGGGSVMTTYDNGTNQSTPVAGGGIGAAVDAAGSLWSINTNGNGVAKFTDAGAFSASYSGGGISAATALAIDGNGVVWIANGAGSISALTNAGTAVSTTPVAAAGNMGAPASITVDAAGSLWLANPGNNTVTEVIGAAAPVTTPTVQQVITGNPGARP